MDTRLEQRPAAEQFGDLLRVYRKQCWHPEDGIISQHKLADLLAEEDDTLEYDGRRVSLWERGKEVIRHSHRPLLLGLVQVLHKYGGIGDRETADTFLTTGQYSALTEGEAFRINPAWVRPYTPPEKEAPPPQPEGSEPSLVDEVKRALHLRHMAEKYLPPLPEPPITIRTSTIWVVSCLGYLPWLKLVIVVGLVLLNQRLLTPALIWPQFAAEARMVSYAGFAAAHWVVPLIVALLITPEGLDGFTPQGRRDEWHMFFLKWVGALVGFMTVSLAIWLVNLGLYYVGWGWASGGIRWTAAIGSLFLAWVVGGVIPRYRWHMFGGRLHAHKVDILLFAAGLTMPWIFMAFFHLMHDVWTETWFGTAIFISLGMLILWERRHHEASHLSQGQLFGLLGVLGPFGLFWVVRATFTPTAALFSAEMWLELLIWLYLTSVFSYWMAIKIWGRGVWDWRKRGYFMGHLLLILVGVVATIMALQWVSTATAVVLFVGVLAAVVGHQRWQASTE